MRTLEFSSICLARTTKMTRRILTCMTTTPARKTPRLGACFEFLIGEAIHGLVESTRKIINLDLDDWMQIENSSLKHENAIRPCYIPAIERGFWTAAGGVITYFKIQPGRVGRKILIRICLVLQNHRQVAFELPRMQRHTPHMQRQHHDGKRRSPGLNGLVIFTIPAPDVSLDNMEFAGNLSVCCLQTLCAAPTHMCNDLIARPILP